MITKGENLSIEKHSQVGLFAASEGDRKTISPAERWLLVTEKAYYRAQRRGFVGGDPVDDWAEAEQEVDAIYDTDPKRVFVQADAEKLAEQVRDVFGGYGLGHLGLDAILEKHRDGLDRLTEQNRRMIDSTSELVTQQASLFQDAVTDAMETLQSFTQGRVSADAFTKQAELSARAMENVLSYFKELTESASDNSLLRKKGEKGK